jgi:hypothetical protein
MTAFMVSGNSVPRPDHRQLTDEHARCTENDHQRQQCLQAGHGDRRVRPFGLKEQRFGLLFGAVAGVAHLGPRVRSVREQEQPAAKGLDGEGHEPERDLAAEDQQEPALIAAQTLRIEIDWPRRAAGEQQHQPDHRIGDGCQHQRAAQCRADANVPGGGILTHDHRDESDHAFGQCGAEGREHRADRVLRHAGHAPHPLHAVDEVLAGPIDDTGREEQDDEC